MKKQVAAIATALLLVCAMPIASVHAEPETEEAVTETIVEEYSYTQAVSSSLSISGSSAACLSIITGKSTCTRIEATQKLQKKTLWWWSDVNTWSSSVNGKSLAMSNYGTAASNGTYRVRVDAVVYSGSNSEAVYANSVEVVK